MSVASNNIFKLQGKVALITGAGSGIGATTAIFFAKLGAKLSLTGRNEENLNKVAGECKAQDNDQPFIVCGDICKEEDVVNIVEKTIGKYGQLDILVNCAGIMRFGSIETTSLKQYDDTMNANMRSVYHLTHLAVPHLLKTKGCIVNVSSVAGTRSFPNILAYCVSKSALDQFTSCVSLELASKGIRVNSVNPGVIITELQKKGGITDEAYKIFLEQTKKSHPLGRAGTTDEVADAIAFLASPLASNITGEHLHVDGGRHATCLR